VYVYEAQLNSLFFENFCQILNITKSKKKAVVCNFETEFFLKKKKISPNTWARGVAMGYCRAMV
jgi:hypothetical protein